MRGQVTLDDVHHINQQSKTDSNVANDRIIDYHPDFPKNNFVQQLQPEAEQTLFVVLHTIPSIYCHFFACDRWTFPQRGSNLGINSTTT